MREIRGATGMTDTPTAATIAEWNRLVYEYTHWRDSNGSIGFKDANNLSAALRQAADACEALIKRNDACELFAHAEAEGKRAAAAEARVAALELEGAEWDEQHAQQHRVNTNQAKRIAALETERDDVARRLIEMETGK